MAETSEVPESPAAWPMVGREQPLRELTALLAASQSVLVTGPAGTGKTHLIRCAGAALADSGAPVAWVGGAASLQAIPLGGLAHLIEIHPPGPAPDADQLAAAVVRTLTSTGDDVPLVVVDDLHLLDPISGDLIRNLVASGRVVVAATARVDGDSDPHPVGWREPLVTTIELEDLSEVHVGELLVSVLGAPVDRYTVRRIHEATGGNPLGVRELVRSLRRSGALVVEQGWWRWTGSQRQRISIPELISRRVAQLDPDARAALEVVVVGDPLAVGLARGLADADALALLERDGLVTVDVGPHAVTRPAHPLHAEAIRAALPPARHREICAALAGALAERDEPSDDDMLRVAVWQIESHGQAEPRVCLRAARRAWTLGDAELAERLARHVLEGPDPNGFSEEARYLLGEALADRGRFDDAVAEWAQLEGSADEELRSVAVASMGQLLAVMLDRPDDAIEVIDRTLNATVSGPARDRLVGARAIVSTWAGDRDAASDAASSVLQGASTAESELKVLIVTMGLDLLAMRTEVVSACLPRARALAEGCRDTNPGAQTWLVLLSTVRELAEGRPGAAEAEARAALEWSLDRSHEGDRGLFLEAVGTALLEQGRVGSALAHLEEALPLRRRYGAVSVGRCLQLLAMARAMAGDTDGAARAWAEVEPMSSGQTISYVPEGVARAWVAASAGRISEARTVLASAAEQARSSGSVLHEVLARRDAARLGDARVARDRLRELAQTTGNGYVAVLADLASGMADRHTEKLRSAGDALDAGGMTLLAAEAFRAAARAALRSGGVAVSRACEVRAQELVGRCEGAVTPLVATPSFIDPLTAREQEVAGLVTRGLSDRAVAEQLGLSVRTVHAHLRSIYAKLDIRGRAELTSM